jgi:hypothetical protein
LRNQKLFKARLNSRKIMIMKRQAFILVLTLALFTGRAAAQCVNVGSNQTICQGGTTAGLGGAFADGTTAAVWNDGGAGGSFSPNANALNATWKPLGTYTGTATLTLTATAGCTFPILFKSLTVTVTPNLPVSVTISPSANPVCAGTTVTFTATPVNGGTPTYQWYKNTLPVGTNSPTYAYVHVNGDQIYVQLTSGLTCETGSPANSNTITMTVNPNLPVSVTIAASANPVCAGTPVTFTATPVNGDRKSTRLNSSHH